MSTISRPVSIKPAVEFTAASPSHVPPIELQLVDVARIPLRSDPRIARLDQRACEIERAATASDDAVTSQNIADVQHREHRRFVRFLALVALHPDWLVDGSQGIQVAPHAPSEISAAYADWHNYHQRQQIVAQVRQATLDGIHRVPPELASEIEAAIGAIGPRLPAPPPLRDDRGRVSPAGDHDDACGRHAADIR